MTTKEYNAADAEQVKQAREQVKQERDQELEDIKYLMETAQGVRFFKRLFEKGRIFHTSFTGNSQTFFLEGHRNLALQFFNDVALACPEKIAELMENEEEKGAK